MNNQKAGALRAGERFKLKPGRAAAYGFDPEAAYTVERVFTRVGYQRVFIAVRELAAPTNVFEARDLR